jgi:hypothetical protein
VRRALSAIRISVIGLHKITLLVDIGLYSYLLGLLYLADHRGRAVGGINCVGSLERWDRGFECHSRQGCLCLFCVCVR